MVYLIGIVEVLKKEDRRRTLKTENEGEIGMKGKSEALREGRRVEGKGER